MAAATVWAGRPRTTWTSAPTGSIGWTGWPATSCFGNAQWRAVIEETWKSSSSSSPCGPRQKSHPPLTDKFLEIDFAPESSRYPIPIPTMASEPEENARPLYNPTVVLLTSVVPLVLFAAQTLHMRFALQPWWRPTKLAYAALRIFFPESIVYFVGDEEWERMWVARDISRRQQDSGITVTELDEGCTLQQLMAIQGGKVFFKFTDGQPLIEENSKVELENAPENKPPGVIDIENLPTPIMHEGSENRRTTYSPIHHAPHTPPRQDTLGLPVSVSPGWNPYRHRSPEAITNKPTSRKPTPPYPLSNYGDDPESPVVPYPEVNSFVPVSGRVDPGRPPRQLPVPHPNAPGPSVPRLTRPAMHHHSSGESQPSRPLMSPLLSLARTATTAEPIPCDSTTIAWSTEEPKHLRRLRATDVPLYFPILHLLPRGSSTVGGRLKLHLSLPPDITTILVIAQLVWAIMNLVLRPAYAPPASLLEMYVIFSLLAFLLERIFLTGLRRPAWTGGYVTVCMKREDYTFEPLPITPHKYRGVPLPAPQIIRRYFYIPLVILTVAYPAVLIAYLAALHDPDSTQGSGKGSAGTVFAPPRLSTAMGVVVGTHILALLGLLYMSVFIGNRKTGREVGRTDGRWQRRGKKCLWAVVILGRVVVGVWGVWQIVSPGKGVTVKSGWDGWWAWPHISG
ncbi:hypothetical protein DFH27DRAFT_610710 [Peziza echinospora]|nr:hypothetical protein DFH27DRAFT_610710 [Peziza echinospora]